MSDLFHEDVADDFIDRVFAVMVFAEQHRFQVLTKRPERMLAYLNALMGRWGEAADWPLLNIWLGVSTEDQPTADERIPLLLQTPAAVRFISAEPLLGPINLSRYLVPPMHVTWGNTDLPPAERERPSTEDVQAVSQLARAAARMQGQAYLDWVIVGGESGPGARPMDVAWARSLVQQCRAAGVACFVKQLGAKPVERTNGVVTWPDVELRDRKGGDPSEWPVDLRVREFPS
jgi:protein gp37